MQKCYYGAQRLDEPRSLKSRLAHAISPRPVSGSADIAFRHCLPLLRRLSFSLRLTAPLSNVTHSRPVIERDSMMMRFEQAPPRHAPASSPISRLK